jgi:hypothetical protein
MLAGPDNLPRKDTAISIIIEGHETAFNGFWYQFTTREPLKSLKLTLNYYENGSMCTCNHLYIWTILFAGHMQALSVD